MTIPKPWMLPLIVVALLAPLAAGLALLGPQGLVLGALIAAIALVLIAARPSPRARIEVATADDGHHHALVALLGAIDDRALAQQVARHVERESAAAAERRETDVLLVSPALNPLLDHWAADVSGARADAERRLDASLNRLASTGVPAHGSIGDSNPVLAVEDALREFPADEVIVVGPEDATEELAAEIRRRLDRPVELLTRTARR